MPSAVWRLTSGGLEDDSGSPEAEVGRFPALKDAKLLIVEPARNVSEAEQVEVCLPSPHETQGDNDDNTVSKPFFNSLFLFVWR